MAEDSLRRFRGRAGTGEIGLLNLSFAELGIQVREAALLFGDQYDAAGRSVESVYDADERAGRLLSQILEGLVFECIYCPGLAFYANTCRLE